MHYIVIFALIVLCILNLIGLDFVCQYMTYLLCKCNLINLKYVILVIFRMMDHLMCKILSNIYNHHQNNNAIKF